MGIQLEKGQTIAGYPAIQIRNILRGIGEDFIRPEWLIGKGFSQKDASHLIESLLAAGLIQDDSEMAARWQGGPFFKLTEEGAALARATGATRVHRKTAEQTLNAFMDRVRLVNDSPEFAVRVTEVVIFGSYLGGQEKLGDLDIGCKYELKIANSADFVKVLREHFRASGRPSRGIADHFWPWEQVKIFLKNKKRTISLHPVEEVQEMIRQDDSFRFEVLLGNREEIIARSRL